MAEERHPYTLSEKIDQLLEKYAALPLKEFRVRLLGYISTIEKARNPSEKTQAVLQCLEFVRAQLAIIQKKMKTFLKDAEAVESKSPKRTKFPASPADPFVSGLGLYGHEEPSRERRTTVVVDQKDQTLLPLMQEQWVLNTIIRILNNELLPPKYTQYFPVSIDPSIEEKTSSIAGKYTKEVPRDEMAIEHAEFIAKVLAKLQDEMKLKILKSDLEAQVAAIIDETKEVNDHSEELIFSTAQLEPLDKAFIDIHKRAKALMTDIPNDDQAKKLNKTEQGYLLRLVVYGEDICQEFLSLPYRCNSLEGYKRACERLINESNGLIQQINQISEHQYHEHGTAFYKDPGPIACLIEKYIPECAITKDANYFRRMTGRNS